MIIIEINNLKGSKNPVIKVGRLLNNIYGHKIK